MKEKKEIGFRRNRIDTKKKEMGWEKKKEERFKYMKCIYPKENNKLFWRTRSKRTLELEEEMAGYRDLKCDFD